VKHGAGSIWMDVTPPKMAGAYWLGGRERGIAFVLEHRPRWLHRLMTRCLLGWEWRDGL